jgi:hypothetical protein
MVLIEDIVEDEANGANNDEEFHDATSDGDGDFEDAESPAQSPFPPSRDGEMFESCCASEPAEPSHPSRDGEMFESCSASEPAEDAMFQTCMEGAQLQV